MRIIALDPSSSCCGYAVDIDGKVIDAGKLLPAKKTADAMLRIMDMLTDLSALLRENEKQHGAIDAIIIEIPSGKTHTWLAKQRGGANVHGLSTYGVAVGAVWQRAAMVLPSARVVLVDANQWTGGKKKALRLQDIAMRVPAYDRAKDMGGDVGDAIGLTLWFREQLRRQALRAVAKDAG